MILKWYWSDLSKQYQDNTKPIPNEYLTNIAASPDPGLRKMSSKNSN